MIKVRTEAFGIVLLAIYVLFGAPLMARVMMLALINEQSTAIVVCTAFAFGFALLGVAVLIGLAIR